MFLCFFVRVNFISLARVWFGKIVLSYFSLYFYFLFIFLYLLFWAILNPSILHRVFIRIRWSFFLIRNNAIRSTHGTSYIPNNTPYKTGPCLYLSFNWSKLTHTSWGSTNFNFHPYLVYHFQNSSTCFLFHTLRTMYHF